MRYIAAAAGNAHTVLLRSDGLCAVFGSNKQSQCGVPELPGSLYYVSIAAGLYHSVLIRSDGAALAFGSNHMGKCDVPVLSGESVCYVAAAAGGYHTVLLRSDGQAVAFGDDEHGQCRIPQLPADLHFVAASAGHEHTALLRSDGHIVVFGSDARGQLQGPLYLESESFRLPAAVTAVVVTLHATSDGADGMHVLFTNVGGDKITSVHVDPQRASLGGLRRMIAARLREPLWEVAMVRPDDESVLAMSNDDSSLADVFLPSRAISSGDGDAHVHLRAGR